MDAFVTALAEYGELRDELIRDRIVVGRRSAALSEKLQLKSDLTPGDGTHPGAAGGSHQDGTGVDKPDLPVGFVNKGKPYRRGYKCKDRARPRQNTGSPSTRPPSTASCSRCGATPTHDRAHCPAKDAVCRKCGKWGHYAKVCQSPAKVSAVHESDRIPLGVVGSGEQPENPWVATTLLNGKPVPFHRDTGADVRVIPTSVWLQLDGAELRPSQRTLRGPSQEPLPVIGHFEGEFVLGNLQSHQDVYVVNNLPKPLLGRATIEALELLTRVRAVKEYKSPTEQFPELFNGLGKMEGDYSIKLKGAAPFALSTPRRVAIPLMSRVKDELKVWRDWG